MDLITLAIWSFLSATLLPLGPEPAFVVVLVKHSILITSLWASIWSTLGSMTSYILGYFCKWEWMEKYLRIKKEKIEIWSQKSKRWGVFVGLLAWMPFIGDIFPVIMGLFRYGVVASSLTIFAGKFIKFFVFALLLKYSGALGMLGKIWTY